MQETEILIAGGGIAGLSAAVRLAADGHQIVVVDPAPAASDDTPQASANEIEVKNGTTPPQDLRTTAFLKPGIDTLTYAGVWDDMQASGAQLRVMRIIDAGGTERTPRETADFDGAETKDGYFGWNITNIAAKAALLRKIATLDNVRLINECKVTGFAPPKAAGPGPAIVTLSDGQKFSASLVLAADGRNSTLRDLAGIRFNRWSYDQDALVFAVSHETPHDNISTEIHRSGGPLTLVPMPDHNGHPCSSVVWMVPHARAQQLAALDDAALARELQRDTMNLFGTLNIVTPRAVWPMVAQVAHRLTAPRLALIAETAHVVPPIGAQGLNMSLHDIETLAKQIDLAKLEGKDIGSDALLKGWERRQLPKTVGRVGGIDLLNRAAMAEPKFLRDLRYTGLCAINHIGPLRRLAIKAGIGK
ncbi:FAD-dependent oxidoreductase [Thalassospira sp. TSL5-1]|uniref:FAD-dependent oxidoreductase n=1 Tax=Thalassospira sp. TSL5-1 TaxID=1544451 RepID=UPI00093929D1|nr:FAD-dependent oxidoreductase [Thalassospira sp. TSL5-1]OKH89548.1 2-octaprenyl-6-methoxyphenyl hydroxylase [Thalassospira sp. TSL5-1]